MLDAIKKEKLHDVPLVGQHFISTGPAIPGGSSINSICRIPPSTIQRYSTQSFNHPIDLYRTNSWAIHTYHHVSVLEYIQKGSLLPRVFTTLLPNDLMIWTNWPQRQEATSQAARTSNYNQLVRRYTHMCCDTLTLCRCTRTIPEGLWH